MTTISISFEEEAINADSPRPKKLHKKSISDSTPLQHIGKVAVQGAPASVVQGAPASNNKSKSTDNGGTGSDISSEDWSGDDGSLGSTRTANTSRHAVDDTRDTKVDDTEEYNCLIVEEIPPSSNDT